MEDPESWVGLVRAQDGLVTRQQALAHGISRDTITAHLDGGRWTLRAHGVIATFTGPLSPGARHRVALLFVPEDLLYVMPGGELIVRLDGWRYHADRRTAQRDRARDNAAELAHRARMVFGWEEVHHDKCLAAWLVGARLRELGWEGQAHPCPRCAPRS